jgi:hypothetical protein
LKGEDRNAVCWWRRRWHGYQRVFGILRLVWLERTGFQHRILWPIRLERLVRMVWTIGSFGILGPERTVGMEWLVRMVWTIGSFGILGPERTIRMERLVWLDRGFWVERLVRVVWAERTQRILRMVGPSIQHRLFWPEWLVRMEWLVGLEF